MKRIVLFSAFYLMLWSGHAQGVEKVFYIDSCENFVSQAQYTFRRVTKSIPGRPFEYEFSDYDRSGNLYTKGIAKSRNGVTRQGDYVFYRADGSVFVRGSYEKGLATGNWVYLNRRGEEVSPDSLLPEAGIVRSEKDGFIREGKCLCYIYHGDVVEITASKEKVVRTYRMGISIGTNGVIDRPDKPASYIPDNDAFNQFMKENLSYPLISRIRQREGVVYAEFIVTSQGVIKDISFLKELDEPTKKKIMKVLSKTSGKWRPGEFEGRKVDTFLVLPVIFDLVPK